MRKRKLTKAEGQKISLSCAFRNKYKLMIQRKECEKKAYGTREHDLL